MSKSGGEPGFAWDYTLARDVCGVRKPLGSKHRLCEACFYLFFAFLFTPLGRVPALNVATRAKQDVSLLLLAWFLIENGD